VIPSDDQRSWHQPKAPDAIRVGRQHFAPERDPASSNVEIDEANLDEALTRARADGDLVQEARLLTIVGVSHLSAGRFDWAVEALSEACDCSSANGAPVRSVPAENNLAVALARDGDRAAAIERLREVDPPRSGRGGQLDDARREINSGILLAHSEDLKGAIDKFDLAFAQARSADAAMLKAAALNNAGLVYLVMGELEEAAGLLDRSALLAQRASASLGLARAYNNLGVLRYGTGRLFEAIPYFEIALSLAQESEDRPLLIELLSNNVLAFEHQYLEPATKFRGTLAQTVSELGAVGESRPGDLAAISLQPDSFVQREGETPRAPTAGVFPLPRALFWFVLAFD
jgi:tetratricopeptide (TPR) repeat protein